MAVLIVTMPNDADAQVVQFAVRALGEECRIFYSGDLAGGATWSFDPSTDVLETAFRGRTEVIAFQQYRSVWMRRPCSIVPREHIQDVRERAAAESESTSFLNAIYRNIERNAFVANRLYASRIAQEKAHQFRVARDVGLPLPATIISNSPERVMTFYREWNGRIIYKTLVPMLWNTSRANYGCVRTTVIEDPEILATSDLMSAPGIYQQVIDKSAEVRVTIFGRTVLALEKRFPGRSPDSLDVDWRMMQRGAVYRRHELCQEIIEKCRALLHRLGLVMGCLDFAIDREGRYYFLEINPQGQFLWGDQVCADLNHLEAMAEFLIAASPDFTYSNRNRINFAQFADRNTYSRLEAQEREEHFSDLHTFRYSAASVPLIAADPLPDEVIQAQVAEQLKTYATAAITQEG